MRKIGKSIRADEIQVGDVISNSGSFYYILNIEDKIIEYEYFDEQNYSGVEKLDRSRWNELDVIDILVDTDPFLGDCENKEIKEKHIERMKSEFKDDYNRLISKEDNTDNFYKTVEQYLKDNSEEDLLNIITHFLSPYEILKRMKPLDINNYFFENNIFDSTDKK